MRDECQQANNGVHLCTPLTSEIAMLCLYDGRGGVGCRAAFWGGASQEHQSLHITSSLACHVSMVMKYAFTDKVSSIRVCQLSSSNKYDGMFDNL